MSGLAYLPLLLFGLPALAWVAVHLLLEAQEQARRQRVRPRKRGFMPRVIEGGRPKISPPLGEEDEPPRKTGSR